MNGPDIYPDVATQMAERAELMRRACLSAIRRAESGQDVDDVYLESCRAFVAANPALGSPLGTGEPVAEVRS